MPDPAIFLRGVLVGLTAAVPVGPMAVFAMRTTLTSGRNAGLAIGAGIATADTLFAALAATGISAVTTLLAGHDSVVRIAGGLFLVGLGIAVMRSARAPAGGVVGPGPLGRSSRGYATLAFGLTLTNPMTILAFAAMIAGYGAVFSGSAGSVALLALGVFCGSMGWWLVLTTATSLVRDRFDQAAMRRVNLASGAVIAGFGVLALLAGVR
jgi:threonine/homoserine/homoserine lactone efflux protein